MTMTTFYGNIRRKVKTWFLQESVYSVFFSWWFLCHLRCVMKHGEGSKVPVVILPWLNRFRRPRIRRGGQRMPAIPTREHPRSIMMLWPDIIAIPVIFQRPFPRQHCEAIAKTPINIWSPAHSAQQHILIFIAFSPLAGRAFFPKRT